MNDTLMVTGMVSSTPRHTTTEAGVQIASLRLASQQSAGDLAESTNWYTVFVIGEAAPDVAENLRKGDRIVVSGTLRIREWGDEVHSGVSVELTAEAIGVDLARQPMAPSRIEK